jgi:methylenetetrahydrofolate dehydrogenase (NADP+)/methenyltetrahydrofolate cyclohydrolase
MQILDGKLVSASTRAELKLRVMERVTTGKKIPHLAAILIGNNGASETYIANKIKSCAEVGIKSSLVRLDEKVSYYELVNEIQRFNEDTDVDGILVQLPLPAGFDEESIIQMIDPSKDVDGFHPVNVGNLVLGLPGFVSATPYGVMLMLEHYKIPTAGKHAVIIGRSNIVGRPMSILLSQNSNPGNCTVTLCHSKTENLAAICQSADIIVAALGRPKFLTAEMVKEGAVVIDVGITRVEDASTKTGYRIVGDADFDNIAEKCSYISPVPGGVGVMTITALLKNTFQACIEKDD